MNGKQIVELVEKNLSDSGDGLENLLKENPRYGLIFTEHAILDIEINLIQIKKVVLTLGYLVGKK